MPDKDLLEESMNREITGMEILLSGKGARLGVTLEEYVEYRLWMGASKEVVRAELLKDLKEGGRIFGEFKRSITATAKGAVYRIRDNAEFAELGVITTYRWVAVLVNTCPDCLERHGQVKTWEEWEQEGLPRTGQTVCREHCKCVLLPAETTEIEPVKRAKK